MDPLSEYVEYYLTKLRTKEAGDAWHSLIEAGPEALPLIVEAYAQARDRCERVTLVQVVCQYRAPAAAPFLAGLLHDPDPEVWKTALDGLVTLGGAEAVRLLESFQQSADREKREWVSEAMEQIAEGG
jgi:HEAT repeat protein